MRLSKLGASNGNLSTLVYNLDSCMRKNQNFTSSRKTVQPNISLWLARLYQMLNQLHRAKALGLLNLHVATFCTYMHCIYHDGVIMAACILQF